MQPKLTFRHAFHEAITKEEISSRPFFSLAYNMRNTHVLAEADIVAKFQFGEYSSNFAEDRAG